MEKQSPEEKAYNRQRMLEVRTEVRQFVEKGHNPYGLNHLGELPQTPEDATRVIIALQDMLDDSRARHAKATKAMETTVNFAAGYDQSKNMVIGNQHAEIVRRGDQVKALQQLVDSRNDECVRLSEGWQQANMDVNTTQMENEKLQRRVQTLLDTIAIMNEGMV